MAKAAKYCRKHTNLMQLLKETMSEASKDNKAPTAAEILAKPLVNNVPADDALPPPKTEPPVNKSPPPQSIDNKHSLPPLPPSPLQNPTPVGPPPLQLPKHEVEVQQEQFAEAKEKKTRELNHEPLNAKEAELEALAEKRIKQQYAIIPGLEQKFPPSERGNKTARERIAEIDAYITSKSDVSCIQMGFAMFCNVFEVIAVDFMGIDNMRGYTTVMSGNPESKELIAQILTKYDANVMDKISPEYRLLGLMGFGAFEVYKVNAMQKHAKAIADEERKKIQMRQPPPPPTVPYTSGNTSTETNVSPNVVPMSAHPRAKNIVRSIVQSDLPTPNTTPSEETLRLNQMLEQRPDYVQKTST